MRTTLDIDENLLRLAKRRAAEQNLSVSDVANEALRTALSPDPSVAAPFHFITYGRGAATTRRHEAQDFGEALEAEDREGCAVPQPNKNS